METDSSLPPLTQKPKNKKKNNTSYLSPCDANIIALVNREQVTIMDVVCAIIKSPRSYLYSRVELLEQAEHLKRWQPHYHAEQYLLSPKGRIPRKPWHRRNTAITSACLQLALPNHPAVKLRESDIWELPSTPKPVRPDRLFFLDIPDENGDLASECYSLEDDEDTESVEEFTLKCMRYWNFYDRYIFQSRKQAERQGTDWQGNEFDIDSLRVLITVPHEQRLERILQVARRAVAKASNGATRGLGMFWCKTRPFSNTDRESRRAALEKPEWVINGWRTAADDELHSILE